ncbi:MAG: nucleotidyltransferase family protein [Anaerococcus sp.]|nr:nucleotidyltransferase family protein [Anaerococcus sp.]
MKISAIIMASGLSERMGTNKLLMKVFDKKLYQQTLDLVEKVGFDQVILVSSYKEILEDGENRGFISLYNENNIVGKSESIKLGVNNTKEDSAMMFFVADQPLLSLETVKVLIEEFRKNPMITYPRSTKRRGAPVIFPSQYRDDLLNLTYDQGGMVLVKDDNKNEVLIEDVRELWDVDTYENLMEIRDLYE